MADDALRDLRDAIEKFASSLEDGVLVNAAVVFWEEVKVADDPERATADGMMHRTTYTVPAGSSSNAIGLARIGEQLMMRDVLSDDEED